MGLGSKAGLSVAPYIVDAELGSKSQATTAAAATAVVAVAAVRLGTSVTSSEVNDRCLTRLLAIAVLVVVVVVGPGSQDVCCFRRCLGGATAVLEVEVAVQALVEVAVQAMVEVEVAAQCWWHHLRRRHSGLRRWRWRPRWCCPRRLRQRQSPWPRSRWSRSSTSRSWTRRTRPEGGSQGPSFSNCSSSPAQGPRAPGPQGPRVPGSQGPSRRRPSPPSRRPLTAGSGG